MPTTSNLMPALYARLSKAGLPRAYVRNALPDWWDDEISRKPAGHQQGLLILAQHLGLDLAALLDPAAPIVWKALGPCKYKRPVDVGEDQLVLCRALATRIAQLAAAATPGPFQSLPLAAFEVRQAILSRGVRWVGLSELLDYCWSMGVPVLHLDSFPKGACRPDGFAANVAGRPVIVLCKRSKQPAWLLFILAHELGHVALGHVPENGSIVDVKIEANSPDEEEDAANTFAAELLTGTPPRRFHAPGRWPTAETLAREARRIGTEDQIDPGHVILNYSHAMGRDFFRVGNAALARLDPQPHAVRTVRNVMADRLDWEKLPADTSEFLMRVAKNEAAG